MYISDPPAYGPLNGGRRKMWSRNAAVLEPHEEAESISSGSMSAYGNDVDDVELELRKENARRTVPPHIVIGVV